MHNMRVFLWWFLCICASLCGDAASAASVRLQLFNVTKTDIVNSWQSSEVNNRCFRDTAIAGNWDYFYSANNTDPMGYQWLLVQLRRPIRVQAVSVYVGPTDPTRAEDVQILLSQKLLPHVIDKEHYCHASLSTNTILFSQCGVTRRTVDSRKLRVECSYDLCWTVTYILLKKHFVNETHKIMQFEALEIEEGQWSSPELRLSPSSSWRDGNIVRMRLCDSGGNSWTAPRLSCLIETPFGNRSLSGISMGIGSTTFSLTVDTNWPHSASLVCLVNQSGLNETWIRHRLPPRPLYPMTVRWPTFRDQSVVEGHHLSVEVAADGNPEPSSRCWLQLTDGSLIMLTRTQQRQFISRFSTIALASMNDSKLNCLVAQAELSNLNRTFTQLITVFARKKPELQLPPSSSWRDGDTVRVLLYDTANSRIPTSYSCFLETPHGNMSLPGIYITPRITDYRLRVEKNWPHPVSLVCLVNQSGLIETWIREQLPRPIYPMSVKWSTRTQAVKEGDILLVEVTADGNPEPSSQCSLQLTDGSLSVLSRTQHSRLVSSFSIVAREPMNGRHLTCIVSQAELSPSNRTFTQLITVSKPLLQPMLLVAVLSTIAALSSVPLAVCCLRQTGHRASAIRGASEISRPGEQTQATAGITLVPLASSRDPNTVYDEETVPRGAPALRDPNTVYDEEETLPSVAPQAARDPNTVYYSENGLPAARQLD